MSAFTGKADIKIRRPHVRRRPSLNLWSISKQPKRSASRCRRRCSLAPTRWSIESILVALHE